MQVPEGEICGFLGANGSGKTTTIRMLCGLLHPGRRGGDLPRPRRAQGRTAHPRRVGYMTQRFSLYEDLTVRRISTSSRGSTAAATASGAIDDVLERIGPGRSRRTSSRGELSGGWKQRLALAACVLHGPELLLLDEPTAGVDPKARREFWDLIHALAGEGITVLVSTHYMDEAERCHRIVYLSGGRLVVEGSAPEVIALPGSSPSSVPARACPRRRTALDRAPGVESVAVFGRRSG